MTLLFYISFLLCRIGVNGSDVAVVEAIEDEGGNLVQDVLGDSEVEVSKVVEVEVDVMNGVSDSLNV